MFGRQSTTPAQVPTVTSVFRLASVTARDAKLHELGARFRKYEDVTGRRLFKTPAGVVLRENGIDIEVLSNCVC